MKNTIIAILIVVLVGVGVYFWIQSPHGTEVTTNTTQQGNEQVTGTQATTQENKEQEVIGTSVEGRDIVAYHFGTGSKEILLVGGLHGGYEWNTTLVAYEAIDYLKANPTVIPSTVKVTIIPVANPDGLVKVVPSVTGTFTPPTLSPDSELAASARFNGHNVDLNRNFDCDWQAKGTWQTKTVSGGTAAFSEPESLAIRDYITAHPPTSVLVWYSAAGGVFASNCHQGVLPETNKILDVFSKASGYRAYQEFNFYEITGDMVNWLAKKNIPAFSVLLTNHQDTEWAKNEAGIKALLAYYAQ